MVFMWHQYFCFWCDLPVDLECLVKDSPADPRWATLGRAGPGEGEWHMGYCQSAVSRRSRVSWGFWASLLGGRKAEVWCYFTWAVCRRSGRSLIKASPGWWFKNMDSSVILLGIKSCFVTPLCFSFLVRNVDIITYFIEIWDLKWVCIMF